MAVTDADLVEHFTKYGKVAHAIAIKKSDSDECRGFGFVSFEKMVRFI